MLKVSQYTLDIFPNNIEDFGDDIKRVYPEFCKTFVPNSDLVSIQYVYEENKATHYIRVPHYRIPIGAICPLCEGYVEGGIRYHKHLCSSSRDIVYRETEEGAVPEFRSKPGKKPGLKKGDRNLRGQILINVSINKDKNFLIAILNRGIVEIRMALEEGLHLVDRALEFIEEHFRRVGIDVSYPRLNIGNDVLSKIAPYIRQQKNTYDHIRNLSVNINNVRLQLPMSYTEPELGTSGVTYHLSIKNEESNIFKVTVKVSLNVFSIHVTLGNVQSKIDREAGFPSKASAVDLSIAQRVYDLLMDTVLGDEDIYIQKSEKRKRQVERIIKNTYTKPDFFKGSGSKEPLQPPGGIYKKEIPVPYPYSFLGTCPTGYLPTPKAPKGESGHKAIHEKYYKGPTGLPVKYDIPTFSYFPACTAGYAGLGIFSSIVPTTEKELRDAVENYRGTPRSKIFKDDPYFPAKADGSLWGSSSEKWIQYILYGKFEGKEKPRPGKVMSSRDVNENYEPSDIMKDIHSAIYIPGKQSRLKNGTGDMILDSPFRGLANFSNDELIELFECLVKRIAIRKEVPTHISDTFETKPLYFNSVDRNFIKPEEWHVWRNIPKESIFSKIVINKETAYFIDEKGNNYSIVDCPGIADRVIYAYVHDDDIIPINTDDQGTLFEKLNELGVLTIGYYNMTMTLLEPGLQFSDSYLDPINEESKTLILNTCTGVFYIWYPEIGSLLLNTSTFQFKVVGSKLVPNGEMSTEYIKEMKSRDIPTNFTIAKMTGVLSPGKIYLFSMNYWTEADGTRIVKNPHPKSNFDKNIFTPIREIGAFTETARETYNKYISIYENV